MTTTITAPALATLVGSEKQIAWANKIRTQYLADIAGYRARRSGEAEMQLVRGVATQEQVNTWFATLDRCVVVIAAQTSASWWIDRRNMSYLAMIDEAHKALPVVVEPVADVVEVVEPVAEPVAEVVEVIAEAAPVAAEVAPVPQLSAPVAYSGTAKQIAWAKQIRHTMLVAAIQYRSSVPAADIGAYDAALISLSAMHHAAWWIDTRSLCAPQLIAKIAARTAA